MRKLVLAAAFAAAFVATRASALDFHGYFRDGPGFNSKGGGQACFALPGADFKARLGNECDHYWELSISDSIYKDKSGIEARAEFMPAYGQKSNDLSGGGGAGYGNGSTYTQQVWGGLKVPQLGGVHVWAGQRYFRRHNVEGLDWFYWNPYQGNAAAGIEDIDLGGVAKLAVTLGRVDPSGVGTSAQVATYMRPEVRVYGIGVNPGGTLEVGVNLDMASDQKSALGNKRQDVSPWITVEHVQDKVLGGSNRLTAQYASGASATMGSGVLAGASSKPQQWRVIEQLVFQVTDWSGQVALVYQDQDKLFGGAEVTGPNGNGASIFSAEVRPSYHVNDWFKLQVDAFYQTISVKNAPGLGSVDLFKGTLAPTLVGGRGFFARPELRVYATYASWSDGAAKLGQIANGAFGTDKNGLSYGVQMEAWF